MFTGSPNALIAEGNARAAAGDARGAEDRFHRAAVMAPGRLAAWYNLANARRARGRLADALDAYDRAAALAPDHPEVRWNRALTRLLAGDLAAGFADYGWRWKRTPPPPHPGFAAPEWDGSPLGGRRILLWAEQGLGDTVQFVRYAARVADRGGRVALLVPRPLATLVATAPGVETVASGLPLPPFDVHRALLDLPHLFATTLDTIPAAVPYLSAPTPDPRPAPPTRPRIGVCWAGNPGHEDDARRSIPLAALAPLMAVRGVEAVSLQVGLRPGDAERLARLRVADRTPVLSDFAATASVVRSLDLVVTVDTALAHLAGALGAPTRLLLPFVPDWRWLMGRDDSPWYPSLRLIRQPAPGDWAPVIAAVVREVEARAR